MVKTGKVEKRMLPIEASNRRVGNAKPPTKLDRVFGALHYAKRAHAGTYFLA